MQPENTAPCSRCGAQTALRFGDLPVCVDCYAALASCCAGEFEGESCAKTPANPEPSKPGLAPPDHSSISDRR